MSSDVLVAFSDANFSDEVLSSPKPVVVDFWAEWCGPCKMLTPILEDVAREYEGKVKFGKCNVDDNSTYASRYGVTSIPTILFVKNGNVMDQQVGLLAKAALKSKVDKLLA